MGVCRSTAPALPYHVTVSPSQLNLGFRHYNLQHTDPDVMAKSPRGLTSPTSSLQVFTTAFSGGTTVRCLPVDEASGFMDVPGGTHPSADPTSPPPAAADEDALLAFEGQGRGVTGATQPPQQAMQGPAAAAAPYNPLSTSTASGGAAADRALLNAHWYPSMPSSTNPTAAHNAALCEPMPGDWGEGVAPEMKPLDAISPDEPLDAIHASGGAHSSHAPASGPVGGTSAGAARGDSAPNHSTPHESSFAAQGREGSGEGEAAPTLAAAPAGDQQHQQQEDGQSAGEAVRQCGNSSSGGHGDAHDASRPADDPELIKRVVEEETLHSEPDSRTA